MTRQLFPVDLPGSIWTEFESLGFAHPVSGVIYRPDQAPCCGVPLGGISTGCMDLDVKGVYGFSSIFNPVSPFPYNAEWRMPRKTPDHQPILGLSVGGETWVLASPEIIAGGEIQICTEPYFFANSRGKAVTSETIRCHKIENVKAARQIHYWGHYPIADLEFETGGPVSAGLRAWSPFIPGDTAASNIPAAVFEVHLRNETNQDQQGILALNFPGPDPTEARGVEFTRQHFDEDFSGILVRSTGPANYLLGVIGGKQVRFGGNLSLDPFAWSRIASQLPDPPTREERGRRLFQDPGCSAAVDFCLRPGQELVIRFLLAWFAPLWEGARNDIDGLSDNVAGSYQERFQCHWLSPRWAGSPNYYTHMYASRYESALDVARRVAAEHTDLLARVIAWQSAVYADKQLPVWLRDSLVNNLSLIAEDSLWAQPKPPLGDWAFPSGVFALNESPRGCPDLACIPCDWYGNFPIVYFFPDLARTTLRAFKQYQKETGEIPLWLGKMGDLPDLATPGYHWQVSLNGTCYVDMVYRLWQATGDASILHEFYSSVKKCNTFTMNLRKGPGGVVSMPEVGGMEWFEHGEWAGMATHMGGLHLAQLRLMEHMAREFGDDEYIRQCQDWFADGSRALEEEMWTGSYYLNFYDKDSGKRSEDVMGYQLDGQWVVDFYGLDPILKSDRIKTTLKTIQRCNIALTPDIGAANFTRPDGSALPVESKVAFYGPYAMFPPELLILAMTYMYEGQPEFGLELARKHWENLVLKQRHPWDLPNLVRGDSGERIFGTDYYQNMMLWNLPAAIAAETMGSYTQPGGLPQRVVQAGKAKSP